MQNFTQQLQKFTEGYQNHWDSALAHDDPKLYRHLKNSEWNRIEGNETLRNFLAISKSFNLGLGIPKMNL